MISAAAAGDFEEWGMTDSGVMLDIAISKLGEACESDEEAYKIVLPQVSGLIKGIYERGDLWEEAMSEIRAAEERVNFLPHSPCCFTHCTPPLRPSLPPSLSPSISFSFPTDLAPFLAEIRIC